MLPEKSLDFVMAEQFVSSFWKFIRRMCTDSDNAYSQVRSSSGEGSNPGPSLKGSARAGPPWYK